MKKDLKIILGLCVLLFVVSVLLGLAAKPQQKEWTTYTVRPGDKLWDIAEELEVQNWNQWLYETCEVNGIQQGGMIHPGDVILTYREVR